MSEISHVRERTASQPAGNAGSLQGQRKWSTRKLVVLALFTALTLILSFIEAPIFPAAPFLKYDASNVVVAFAACSFGPVAGCIVGIVAAAIHGLIMGDPWGSLMTIITVVCWIVPLSLIYRAKRNTGMFVLGLVVATIASLAGAIGGNLIITPIYTGTDMMTIAAMIVPILLPFNALKLVINDVLAFALHKPVENLVAGE